MAGSTYGTLFRITTWGESHGPAIGVVIDGCRPGLVSKKIFKTARPKTWSSKFTTKRNESDTANSLRCFRGKTTGTPICHCLQSGPAFQELQQD